MASAGGIPVIGFLFLFLVGSLQIQEAVAFDFGKWANGVIDKAKHLLPCYDECYVPCEKRFPTQPIHYKYCRDYCLTRECIPNRLGKVWPPSYEGHPMYINGEHGFAVGAPGPAPLHFNVSSIENAASGPALPRKMSEPFNINLQDVGH